MSNNNLENDLFLRALNGEHVNRPPVWMMRQAGRYLPEYMVLRRKYDFFTRIRTPELAAEITIQPIDIVGVDAAILFSDILTVPLAMGLEVQMVAGKGPYLPTVADTTEKVESLQTGDGAIEELQYVFDKARGVKTLIEQRNSALKTQKLLIHYCRKLQISPLFIYKSKLKQVLMQYKYLIAGEAY